MINTQELKAALTYLNIIIPRRSTMPILKYLKLKSYDDTLYITASDSETDLTIAIPYSDEKMDICLPGNELKSIIATVKEPFISMSKKKTYLHLTDGENVTKLKFMETDQFPVVNKMPQSFFIDGEIFQTVFKQAAASCVEKKAGLIMDGINLSSKNGNFTVQGADGFKASYIRMMLGTPDFDVVVPEIDTQILKLFSGKIEVGITQNHASFYSKNFMYRSTLLAGNFPEIQRIIPQTHNTEITIEKALLANAVQRALIFSRDNNSCITLAIADNKLSVQSGDSDYGQNSMSFDIEQTGDNITTAVNGNILKSFFPLTQTKIIAQFNMPTSPIVLRIPDNNTFTFMLMPMHLGRR